MIRKFLFSAALLTAASRAGGAGETGPATSQEFMPARYAVTAAEIHAAALQQTSNGSVTRKVALKLDTRTGEVWVLQLSVAGENDPRVLNAVWAPVQSGTVFSVSPPPQQQDDGM